jgi:hypothetical protein
MPALSFGISSYERGEGDLPPLPVVNMYAEQSDSDGVVLQSRRGLYDRSASMGAGPIEQLFKRDGVVSGRLLGVSAGRLYDVTTDKGAIAGSGPVSIAGNELGAMIAAGSTLYKYDGTTLSTVAFPDSAGVVKIIEGSSRFIAIRENSARIYWTNALELTFDALDFATVESESDLLLDGLFIDDALVLFGRETVEFWPNTGDDLLPFQPLQGRVYERGIKQTGCATSLGSSFAWVTDANTVCIGDENNIVSNPGLHERIAAATTVSAFNFFIDGAEFLAIRLDSETQCYNLRAGTWSEFASDGQSNWLAACHAGGVFGSGDDGKTLAFGSGYEELGGVLERRFRAGLPINGGGITIKNLRLRTNPGQTPFLSGVYADATVEFRDSRDGGQMWSDYESASLGVQGDYRQQPEFRALGLASQPGFLCEFRVTDPVPFRVSGVFANEPLGGR